MEKILYIMTPGRQSTEALHWCLHKTKELQLTLRIVYVVDEELSRNIGRSMSEIGFVGETPSAELSEALNKEYQDRAYKIIEEVERQCRTFAIPFETAIKEGGYIDICLEEANGGGIRILTVVQQKEGLFKKFFASSDTSQLVGKIPCELKVYPV